jgi:hypothetical protein
MQRTYCYALSTARPCTEARRASRHMCGSPPGAFKQKIGIESQDFSNPSLLDA